MFNPDEWLEIGKIVAPQGLQGEMRVYPNTDFPERFLEPGERWLLRQGSSDVESVRLLKGRFLDGKGMYVIQLDGITNREQVGALRNSRLWVPAGDRPPLDEGEFHVADLIGLTVYHQATGECIGTVNDVFPAGNDLLEVALITDDASRADLSEPPDLPATEENAPTENEPTERQQPENEAHRKGGKKRKKRSQSKRASTDTHTPNTNTHKTVLIPFVYDIVPVVDLDRQRIEILPPKGLL